MSLTLAIAAEEEGAALDVGGSGGSNGRESRESVGVVDHCVGYYILNVIVSM